MTTKKYFTHREALEAIIWALQEHTDFYYSDLHDITFNSDYYIIGTYKAKKALEQYGVFDALEKIQEWELNIFGKNYPNSDPEQLANRLYYIIGEEVMELDPFNEFYNQVYDQMADDETNALLIEKINETLKTL